MLRRYWITWAALVVVAGLCVYGIVACSTSTSRCHHNSMGTWCKEAGA